MFFLHNRIYTKWRVQVKQIVARMNQNKVLHSDATEEPFLIPQKNLAVNGSENNSLFS